MGDFNVFSIDYSARDRGLLEVHAVGLLFQLHTIGVRRNVGVQFHCSKKEEINVSIWKCYGDLQSTGEE